MEGVRGWKPQTTTDHRCVCHAVHTSSTAEWGWDVPQRTDKGATTLLKLGGPILLHFSSSSLPSPFPSPALLFPASRAPSPPLPGGGQLLNPASGSGRVSSPSRSEQPAAKRFLVNFSPKITLLVTMILKRIAVNYTQTLITHTFE